MSKDWPSVELVELLEHQIGGLWGEPAGTSEEDALVVRITELRSNGGVDFSTAVQRSFTKKQVESRRLRAGDILLEKSGGGPNSPVGRVALIEEAMDTMVCTNFMLLMRPDSVIVDSKYLHQFLTHFHSSGQTAEFQSNSTNIRNISVKDYLRIKVPLPPLEEQKRIVAKLDQALGYVSELDVNIGRRSSSIISLQKSFIRSKHDSVSDWSSKTLPEISENLDSLRIPITKGSRIAGEVPYFGASGIVDYVKDSIFDEDLLLVSEDGANLIARSTAIAFSISGPSWVNNHAHVLRFENLIDQKYVEHYLESINIEDYVSGAAQPKLNQASLNRIPIPWPNDVAVRQHIVQDIEDAITLTSEQLGVLSASKLETQQLRSSILTSAFAGDL